MSLNNPANPLKVSGDAAVSFDDTMTTNDEGVTSVANPMRGILTQAEYDALPEDEKNKGTYVISDDRTGGSSNSHEDVYSIEETRIGTWIDGKPLYAKTYALTTPSSTLPDSMTILATLDKTMEIKNFKGFVDLSEDGGTVLQINYFHNLQNNRFCTLIQDHKICQSVASAYHTSKPCYITIEYTKSTDEPSI